ncbi:hypothetical protein ACFE04_010931 [Oxalis oulophora]
MVDDIQLFVTGNNTFDRGGDDIDDEPDCLGVGEGTLLRKSATTTRSTRTNKTTRRKRLDQRQLQLTPPQSSHQHPLTLLAPLVVGRKGINHDFTVVLKSRHLRTGNHLAVCEIINELQKAFDRVLFSIQVPDATTVSAILFVSITLCAAFARAKQNFNLAATSVVLCGQKQMAKE